MIEFFQVDGDFHTPIGNHKKECPSGRRCYVRKNKKGEEACFSPGARGCIIEHRVGERPDSCPLCKEAVSA